MKRRLVEAVAPYSLSLEKEDTNDRNESNLHNIKLGDIILLQTPGAFYQTFRTLTSNDYDHVVVCVSENRVLHISPPSIRLINFDNILVSYRNPLIFRPKLKPKSLKKFIKDMLKLVGKPYDLIGLYKTVGSLAIKSNVNENIAKFLPISNISEQNICTNAILSSLEDRSKSFRQIMKRLNNKLDYNNMNNGSPNDFITIANQFPKNLKKLEVKNYHDNIEINLVNGSNNIDDHVFVKQIELNNEPKSFNILQMLFSKKDLHSLDQFYLKMQYQYHLYNNKYEFEEKLNNYGFSTFGIKNMFSKLKIIGMALSILLLLNNTKKVFVFIITLMLKKFVMHQLFKTQIFKSKL